MRTKGLLRNVHKIVITPKEGPKFEKLEFEVDVFIDEKNVKNMTGSYSLTFAQRYFDYARTITGKKSTDYIGEIVELETAKRRYTEDDGTIKVVNYIKFINVLDEEGNPIILRNEAVQKSKDDIGF